jgi:hypothetical protein
LTTLLAVAPLAPVLADRPLVSETADVIEAGACQIEAATGSIRASGVPSLREHSGVFTCGFAGHTQPGVTYLRSSGAGTKSERLQVGAKTTLQAPGTDRPGLGVAYSIAALQVPGTTLRLEDTAIVGLLTTELRHTLLGHVNIGWTRSRSARQSSTLWSLGIETTGDFTIAADVFGDDRERPSASAGLGMALTPRFSANLAYAVLFERPRVRQVSLGAKLEF